MSIGTAQVLVGAMALYLGFGLLFAIPFVLRWSGRLDPVAAAGSPGFRALIVPGAVLLWPFLAWRLFAGRSR